MNLWAKRIGQLVLPVALFFFACEDEAKLLGYKNPNSKFEASYVEIPIESSVLLLDSQRTSNFTFQSETARMLIGRYADDKLGAVTAHAFTQFFTNSTAKLPADAVYDSVTLHLLLDYYNYGSRETSTSQSITVYEINEDLQYETRRNYFNTSEASVNPIPLGSRIFEVNPDSLDHYATNRTDTSVLVRVSLDQLFGQKIFDSAIKWRDVATTNDSTFKVFQEFSKIFKGLAIKSDYGDKVLGISTNSAITLHYHTAAADSLGMSLGFFAVTNFSQITSDRASTALAGLTQPSQDFYPADDLRYIGSGTGVYTKLDFSNFFEFCDTVPNVMITSAQLIIGSVEESSLKPPANLVLRILKDDNRLKKVATFKDTMDIGAYNPRFPAHTGTLSVDAGTIVDADLAYYVLGDQDPYLRYASSEKSYSGNFSLFFQQLSNVREDLPRFQYFALYPSAPSIPNTKSVNRVIFPKEEIKLKVYYTKPTIPLN